MKTIPLAVTFLAALLACGACVKTNSVTLVQIDTADYGYTNMAIQVTEMERNKKSSKVRVTIGKRGSAVDGSMFIVRACAKISKARGTEYFTILDDRKERDGGVVMVVGFTNVKDADLKKEFGEQYSYENKSGQKRLFMSVSQLSMIYDRAAKGIEPPAGGDGKPAPQP